MLLQHLSFLLDSRMPIETTLAIIQLFWIAELIVRILCYCLWVVVFVLRTAIPFKIPGRSASRVPFKVTPKSMLENGWKKKTIIYKNSERALKLCREKRKWTLLDAEESIQYPARIWRCTRRGSACKAKCGCSVLMCFNARFPVMGSTVLKGSICQK